MKLDARVVVVTGAGRGLGEAYDRRLAAEGARVAVTAFLLSDEAAYVTGTTLRVDGGHLSYGGFPGVKIRPASLEEHE